MSFVLWLAVFPAHGQQIRFRNYADEDGLGNTTVTALAQDSNGFILLGTESGVFRYDGLNFSPYGQDTGLPVNAMVQALGAETNGRIWVLLHDGLYVNDQGRFSRVTSGGVMLSVEANHRLLIRDRDVVVSASGILLHASKSPVNTRILTPLLAPAQLAAVPNLSQIGFVAADDAALLVGCGLSICRLDGRNVVDLGHVYGLPSDSWQFALRTRDGTIWARSLTKLAWLPRGGSAFQNVDIPGTQTRYLSHPDMLTLLSDSDGRVLTQSDGGLVIRAAGRWKICRGGDRGLPAGALEDMMFDREGLLWVGSRGSGAFRSIGYGAWEHWDVDDGLPSNMAWGMGRVPGQQLWVATDAGAVPVTADDFGRAGIEGTNFIAAASHGGKMWFAPLNAALVRLDPRTGLSEHFGGMQTVHGALVDHDDTLWLETTDGLFDVPAADAPVSAIRILPSVAHRKFYSLTEDRAGTLWAITDTGLLHRRTDGSWSNVTPAALMQYFPRNLGIASDGTLWVGTTSAGVLRFQRDGERLTPLPPLTTPLLSSNTVLFLLRDSRGWMWIGSDHGIDMFDGFAWRRLEKTTGPISNDMDQNSVYEDLDGSMWFGTSHGLSHLLDPTHLPAEHALHPVITRVMLGEKDVALDRTLKTDWSRLPLVISFTSLDFGHERTVRFRYRLLGVDSAWIETSEPDVRYAGLPPGKLVFQLAAFDPLHGNRSSVTSFTIKIRAPWWQRWWFYGLGVLAAAGALWTASRVRVSLLLRHQRRLEQMVRDRTREIERTRAELVRQATTDALTGLGNRRAILARLEKAVAEAREQRKPLAVLLLDIDHFKALNDKWGHLAGDAALRKFGRRLADSLSPDEAAGRYGGEEFLVIISCADDAAAIRVEALRQSLGGQAYDLGATVQPITYSGGLAWLCEDDTVLTLIARADALLYQAKRGGRDRVDMECVRWPTPASVR